jgi:hypothetical protein
MEVWGGNQAVDTGVVMAGLDAWAYSKPWGEDASGGDVHYVSSCASGRIMRMLVADVAGHGNAVAQTAIRLRQLMRRFVNHLDQRRFVAALNNEFGQLSHDGRFATAAAFTFFAPTNHLTISNAGHPPPLLWSAKTRKWRIVSPDDREAAKRSNIKASKRRWARDARSEDRARQRDHANTGGQTPRPDNADSGPANVPLGILDATRYDALTLRLNIGDIVMCYTDGLIECKGRDGRLLNTEGLLEVAREVDTSDPAAFTPALLQKVAQLHEGNLSGDDVTVLLFRPNGLARGLTLRERLHGMRLMTGAAFRAITFRERFPWPDMSLPNVGGAIFQPLSKLWRGR